MTTRPRDLMAPDTEPTDEELEEVTRAALVDVLRRKREGEEWLRRQIEEALEAAKNARRSPR